MAILSEEQARGYMHKLLGAMVQAEGSDLFISNEFPPTMKAHGHMKALASQKLTGEVTRTLAGAMMERAPAGRIREGPRVQLRGGHPGAVALSRKCLSTAAVCFCVRRPTSS